MNLREFNNCFFSLRERTIYVTFEEVSGDELKNADSIEDIEDAGIDIEFVIHGVLDITAYMSEKYTELKVRHFFAFNEDEVLVSVHSPFND